MRNSIGVLSAVFLTTALSSIAVAQTVERHTTTAAAAVTEDCRKRGSEVSALIDNRAGAPNLPAARSVFQVAIMECMEGDDTAANKHYEEAKQLLSEPTMPNPVSKK